MRRMQLGRSGVEVSGWCLGTMTYGNQTPEEDAHRQIDMALEAGIDFIDTAEMYPVNPVLAETAGRSEEIVGNWIARTGRRADVVVATKIAGPGPILRPGTVPDGQQVKRCVEASLKRLRTDVIDLYQIHWPTRGTYCFRQNWTYDPSRQDRVATLAHMDDMLGALADCVAEGKIRAFGLSNETCWGTTRWIDLAEAVGGPRVASVQNEYSLMCRFWDTDAAEMAVNEDVTLLAFSALAAGFLTGKYQHGAVPEGSRMSLVPEMGGRKSERVFDAVAAYLRIAADHGLDPVHLAMAFTTSRPFPVCPIFGATSAAQLERILAGRDVVLSPEVLAAVGEAHKAHPMPY